MARPSRHSSPSRVPASSRVYFATSRTAQGRAILQTERMALLFIDVLRTYTVSGKFTVLEFVVMRNHFHVLLTVPSGMTIEKAVQMIKGQLLLSGEKRAGFQQRDLAERVL